MVTLWRFAQSVSALRTSFGGFTSSCSMRLRIEHYLSGRHTPHLG
jgi:hypothetical protein